MINVVATKSFRGTREEGFVHRGRELRIDEKRAVELEKNKLVRRHSPPPAAKAAPLPRNKMAPAPTNKVKPEDVQVVETRRLTPAELAATVRARKKT